MKHVHQGVPYESHNGCVLELGSPPAEPFQVHFEADPYMSFSRNGPPRLGFQGNLKGKKPPGGDRPIRVIQDISTLNCSLDWCFGKQGVVSHLAFTRTRASNPDPSHQFQAAKKGLPEQGILGKTQHLLAAEARELCCAWLHRIWQIEENGNQTLRKKWFATKMLLPGTQQVRIVYTSLVQS